MADPVTFSASRKGAGVTLSGGDLTATSSQADSVLTNSSKTSGKWYWEILVGTQSQADYGTVGLAFVTQNTGSGTLSPYYWLSGGNTSWSSPE